MAKDVVGESNSPCNCQSIIRTPRLCEVSSTNSTLLGSKLVVVAAVVLGLGIGIGFVRVFRGPPVAVSRHQAKAWRRHRIISGMYYCTLLVCRDDKPVVH